MAANNAPSDDAYWSAVNYHPRAQFVRFHARSERFACIVTHRRAGKTVACIHDLYRAAQRCGKERPRFAYLSPFFRQSKAVAWDYLRVAAGRLAKGAARTHETELRVDYENGGQVRLYGAVSKHEAAPTLRDASLRDAPQGEGGASGRSCHEKSPRRFPARAFGTRSDRAPFIYESCYIYKHKMRSPGETSRRTTISPSSVSSMAIPRSGFPTEPYFREPAGRYVREPVSTRP